MLRRLSRIWAVMQPHDKQRDYRSSAGTMLYPIQEEQPAYLEV
jgi:hypothetical protein